MTENKTGSVLKAALLAAAVLAAAGVAFYFSTTVNAAKASGPTPSARQALSSRAVSLPMFFEPNQGQTDPRVKFLARGAGYGLFLTADEAVLELHQAAGTQHSAPSSQRSAVSSQRASSSVIRMRLDGANSSARVSGASPLPGKSNYFIGNDPSKWRHDIPQFGRVEYQAVYPGVDLVYYGDQGQLEYDFRVAPAADPNQIALSFQGASTHIDSGDLVLSTANGDVRFHAPRVYQQDGNNQKTIAGSFRQIADNKIGFAVGAYDHNRELVIDPVLTYSTYLGGTNTESFVHIAIGPDGNIYLVGSTNSVDFPIPSPPADPPIQSGPAASGATNIFIAVINPSLQPPNYQPYQQLLYATYLGGSGTDSAAGVAVHTALDQLTTGFDIFVAGSTTSTDFPINGIEAAFESGPGPDAGTHGFLARVNVGTTTSSLRYSTYLAGSNDAGNATDFVTGLAIDSAGNAYVTGDTTSTNPISDGFPANPNAYQQQSNSPGNPQFFASEINTTYSGKPSMIYSTYFGGSNPAPAKAYGGGIAVDPTPSNVNMYITGETNMLPTGLNGGPGFPLFNAQQSCLDEAATRTNCTLTSGSNPTDAFIAKINPNQPGSNPIYSTYIGGSGTDAGKAIAVDTSGNAYVTGSTNSEDWSYCNGIQCTFAGATINGIVNPNAFIAKLGNLTGSVYPLNYFTYLGGSGPDIGMDIKVDSLQAAHVAGVTESQNPLLPVTAYAFQPTYGGGASDAFVALISTTLTGSGGAGDYVSYLGGSGADEGTGIALDAFNAAYVAGTTQSANFPPGKETPLQGTLNGTQPNAFVSEIGAVSVLTVAKPTTSPSPNPVAAGTQVAFTFDIINSGPDTASDVTFYAIVPATGLASNASAKVTSGSGTCGPVSGTTIVCNIPTLVVAGCTPTPTAPCGTYAAVEVDVTPSITANVSTIPVSGYAVANGATSGSNTLSQQVEVVDFSISASTSTPSINAGDTATIQVNFCPTTSSITYGGYSASITPSQSTSPSMVTATTPTFTPTPVVLSGAACQNTTLSIATVPRPVSVSRLLRRGSFYAAWLPIGGLSLVGLGIGASRKRRRWFAAMVLGLIAGATLLQSACGSSSSSTSPGGGTQAAFYTITITGSAATGASHNTQVQLTVH
ncbi:MAG: SBBP repeat-containing protein [Candidatus Sulfotelmatobacter sp.]